jgi:hypothetical protein
MSDLSKPTECASFIREWRNMKAAQRLGRNVEEYARSVAMLDAAARE